MLIKSILTIIDIAVYKLTATNFNDCMKRCRIILNTVTFHLFACLLTLIPPSSPSACNSCLPLFPAFLPHAILLFYPPLSTIAKDSHSVQDCLLSSVGVFFDVSSSLCRYYIWLMWKSLTVHSVLRYLFVSQWCTLRSSVAAKQPFSHWAADDSCFILQPKTLNLHFFLLQTLLTHALITL